jgi:hypothetical protein
MNWPELQSEIPFKSANQNIGFHFRKNNKPYLIFGVSCVI